MSESMNNSFNRTVLKQIHSDSDYLSFYPTILSLQLEDIKSELQDINLQLRENVWIVSYKFWITR